MLTLKENVLVNIEDKVFTLGLFIDFSKAFASLRHGILFHKLQLHGVPGTPLNLIRSFLGYRRQCAHIGNRQSSFLPIETGVPQGSSFGPFLFNVYINDIVTIDSKSKFIIYADDINNLLYGPDEINPAIWHNDLLEKFGFWSQCNELKINPTKTKVIFRPRSKLVNLLHVIECEGEEISHVNGHKILGATFSLTSTWDSHIDNISAKLCETTGALSRCRPLLRVHI